MAQYSQDACLKKLFYQSTHRGIKENDVLLGQFAHYLPQLSPAQRQRYAQLLEEPDPDIFLWLMGEKENPKVYQEIVRLIKNKLDLAGAD